MFLKDLLKFFLIFIFEGVFHSDSYQNLNCRRRFISYNIKAYVGLLDVDALGFFIALVAADLLIALVGALYVCWMSCFVELLFKYDSISDRL